MTVAQEAKVAPTHRLPSAAFPFRLPSSAVTSQSGNNFISANTGEPWTSAFTAIQPPIDGSLIGTATSSSSGIGAHSALISCAGDGSNGVRTESVRRPGIDASFGLRTSAKGGGSQNLLTERPRAFLPPVISRHSQPFPHVQSHLRPRSHKPLGSSPSTAKPSKRPRSIDARNEVNRICPVFQCLYHHHRYHHYI